MTTKQLLTREDVEDQLQLVILDACTKTLERCLTNKRFVAKLVAARDTGVRETMISEQIDKAYAQMDVAVSKIGKRLGIAINPKLIATTVAQLRAKGPRS